MKPILLLALLFSLSFAQTYQEYIRSQEEAFSSYKEERDREFSNFLKKEWKAYKELQGVKSYEVEKPKSLPKAEENKSQMPETKVVVEKKDITLQEPQTYSQIIIKPSSEKDKTLYTNFFGVNLQINYDKSILFSMKGRVSKEEISKSWDELAKSDYEGVLNDLNNISKKLRLNDWAKYLLISQVSNAIYQNKNEAKTFSWFVLLKMGYDAHIAYQPQKIILLLPVKGPVYSTKYYKLSGKNYYALDYYTHGDIGTILTYDNKYEGASLEIDFSVHEVPLFLEDSIAKKLSFKFDGRENHIELSYNKNIMNFFQTYPQVSYATYFFASESGLLNESIKRSFEPLIVGKSQSEAVNIILSFVQHAFSYKVDTEQFDKEKVMFPSETLFYPYSDCEDRAILFTYMLKSLLDVDVIGLKYPNHMATAVNIKEKLDGEYIYYNKKKYMIADPSYINANIGLSMLQYKKSKSYEIVSTGGEK